MAVFFQPEMLDFMMDIRFNNSKEFMNANRETYQRIMRDPYHRLIETLAPTMLNIDEQMEVRPVKCLSRIFRDTRYSHDKSPYRDHHWVAFRRQGEPRDTSVLFWFEIRLESVGWGLGYWGENRPALDYLRRQIQARPRELLQLLPIIEERQFQLQGRAYQRKTVPDNLPSALVPWYLKRELYLTKQAVDPALIFQEELLPALQADFLALAPFYRLFRGSLNFNTD